MTPPLIVIMFLKNLYGERLGGGALWGRLLTVGDCQRQCQNHRSGKDDHEGNNCDQIIFIVIFVIMITHQVCQLCGPLLVGQLLFFSTYLTTALIVAGSAS